MNDTTARVAPPADEPQLTEHVHVLMTPDMRAFLIGSKIIDGSRSEATVARSLIGDAIESFRIAAPEQFTERVERGRAELVRRAEAAGPRDA